MRNRKLACLMRLSFLVLWLAVGLVWMPLSSALAQGPPPGRPEPPPGGPGVPPGRPGPPGISPAPSGRPGEDAFYLCSGVFGFVLNWGFGNQPKLPVNLAGDGWQTQKVTDDNGYYAFDCLSAGVGVLNPVLPPDLRPMTSDVALRLGYRPGFEVNLGIYSGEAAPSPEVRPQLQVSPMRALPGDVVTYTIRVVNTSGLPAAGQPMQDVLVTNLLPEALAPVKATVTQGTSELWGNLLTADIGELLPGEEVIISLVASVRAGVVPGTRIANRASLIYHDHIAVQTAVVAIEVGTAGGSEPPATLPVTGSRGPGATSKRLPES